MANINFEQDDTILARWLNGTLTEAEKQALEQHPDFPAFQRIVQAADHLQAPEADPEAMWRKWEQARAAQQGPVRRFTLPVWAAAAAAVGLVLLSVWLFFYRETPAPALAAISTPRGANRELRLPDGSLVRLNAVSSITFDTLAVHWTQKRLVQLSGEAWFEVEKTNVPFVVETGRGLVEVLGTSFTVFQREERLEIVCFAGAVKAVAEGKEQIIRAGQASALRAGVWTRPQAHGDSEPSWNRAESKFEAAPLKNVFEEMERQYDGLEVHFDKTVGERLYSGAFVHGNLPMALRLVCQPMRLKYEINGSSVTIRE